MTFQAYLSTTTSMAPVWCGDHDGRTTAATVGVSEDSAEAAATGRRGP